MAIFSNGLLLTSIKSFPEKVKPQIYAFLIIPSLHRNIPPSFNYLQIISPPQRMAVHLRILQWEEISWSDTRRTDRIMKSEGIRFHRRYFKGCGFHRDIHCFSWRHCALVFSTLIYNLLFILSLNMSRLEVVEERACRESTFLLWIANFSGEMPIFSP